jgi:hypothetical protein
VSRYGDEWKLIFTIGSMATTSSKQDAPAGQEQRVWSMRQCCERLHDKPTKHSKDLETWRREILALHHHLHEKITDATQCPVCGNEGPSRLWVDRRSETTEWTDTALQSLWHAVQQTVRTFGEGWSIWHAVAQAAAKKPLPHKLQQEEVPITALRASKEGGYHWGKYVSSLDVTSKEQALEEIQKQWAQDRLVRIGLLQEQEVGQPATGKSSQGEACILAHEKTSSKKYCGRMWRIGDKWEFQEDSTGITVSVSMDNAADFGRRVYYLRRS